MEDMEDFRFVLVVVWFAVKKYGPIHWFAGLTSFKAQQAQHSKNIHQQKQQQQLLPRQSGQ